MSEEKKDVIVNKEDNEKSKEVDYSDVFIKEDSTFTISVQYYSLNNKLFVKGVDEDFDIKNPNIKSIDIVVKYPNYGDSLTLDGMKVNVAKSDGTIDFQSLIRVEYARFLLLMRKWNLKEKLSEETLLNINPKIIKGILQLMRETIGLDGII